MVSAKLKPPSDDEETMIVTLGDKKATTQPGDARAKIDQVGILSYITFAWIFQYLWSAYKGRLASDQSWPCSIFDSANVNTTRLEHLWNEELRRYPSNPSLFRVVFQFMRFRLLIACVVFLFCLIFGFIGPTCLVKGLISYSENPPFQSDGSISYVNGLYLIFGILAVEISRVLMYGATWAISYRTAIRVRSAILSLLYKSLLNSKSLRSKNSAEIVNICANDGQRIFDAVTFAPLVLMGPLVKQSFSLFNQVIIGGVIYLLKVIGPWSLLGLAVFVIFDILQVFLGITLVRCRRLAVKNTEERLYLMGEILKNIKLIKMNCWEDLFMQKVGEIRDSEKHNLKLAGFAQSIAIASGTIVPVVATIVTVLAVVYSGSDLLASDAFSAITVYFVMLFGIRMIPYGMRYLGEAFVALRKIQQLLLFNKFEPHLSDNHSTAAISLKGATFNWDLEPPTETKPKRGSNEEETALTDETMKTCLNDLSLSIEKREKIGVCGPVGSGKSALLNSILGATVLDKGSISVAGTVAYASQHPCVLGGTIRDNILFGQPMNTPRYEKAITSAELLQDLEKMPSNDSTEVAERGAALSGGQKARLTLARCFYSNRDIYLLDDVLSSTNKEVANSIFNNLMKDMLSNKTVLMVTSNPEYLAEFDRVVFMSNGSVQSVGTHSELLKTNDTYKAFFETKSRTESQEDATPKPTQNGNTQNGTAKIEAPVEKYVTEEEDLGLSNISMDVYTEYIREAGGYVIFGLILLLFIANVGSGIFSTVWLSKWMKDVHRETNKTRGEVLHTGSRSLAENEDITYYSTIYIISIVVLFITGLLKAMAFVTLSIKASTNLHNRMLKSVLHGITSFFDTTPTGRILNLDVKLPFSSEALLQYMITCLGFVLTIIWVFPLFLIIFFPLAAIFVLFFLCFRAGIRSLKRTENISRSPLFDHVTTSLDGLSTIHAFGQNQRFFDAFKNRLDENSSSMFMFNSAMRWQAVWLDLLVVAISFFVSCFIVFLAGKIEPSDAGLALAFALQMSGVFQFAVRSQTELESKLTAVERVSYYYKNIDQEPCSDEDSTNVNWPSSGEIKFNDVVLRYRQNAPAALNHVSFEIPSGQKLGVYGRTGSGKSTLTNALYRLYPLENGTISIDSVDINKVGLEKLRKSMSIIPQESGLFTGTLRFNIDPTNEHSDDKLWESLEKAGLKNLVSSTAEKLLLRIEDGGKNLSSGQRQLVCLARTLLRNVKIVILDEATSVLNQQTDEQIQQAIREAFGDSTLILISHRHENILNLETSMEVENGKVRINTSANADSVALEVPPKTDSSNEQTEPSERNASEK
ncbi:ABC transporter, ATP-binding protein [Aphelenchoides bicaudatus]|nr:ABC transporter, ATP-binding protein [Aphelenchoides bicaudatus]